jgi:hypothetical protein
MQPSAIGGPDGVRRVRADIQEKPLNIEEWWRRREGGVPADQVCCHLSNMKTTTLGLTVAGIFPAILCAEA